jgi:hypothetical protein
MRGIFSRFPTHASSLSHAHTHMRNPPSAPQGLEILVSAAPRVGGRARTAIPAALHFTKKDGGGGSNSNGPTFASKRFFRTRGLATRVPARLFSGGRGGANYPMAILDPDQASSSVDDEDAAAGGGEAAPLRFARFRSLLERTKAAPAADKGADATAATVTATATVTAPPYSSPDTSSYHSPDTSSGEFPYTFPEPPDFDELSAGIAEGFSDVAAAVRSKVKRLQAKTRAATLLQTHPPLPVVGTFEELLRFAKIASLNSAGLCTS